MTAKEFVTYCKALLDFEWERLRLESLRDETDRELAGPLKLIDDALHKVDEVSKNAIEKPNIRRFGPNDIIGPGTYSPEYTLGQPYWKTTYTDGNPVNQSTTRTKQQLND